MLRIWGSSLVYLNKGCIISKFSEMVKNEVISSLDWARITVFRDNAISQNVGALPFARGSFTPALFDRQYEYIQYLRLLIRIHGRLSSATPPPAYVFPLTHLHLTPILLHFDVSRCWSKLCCAEWGTRQIRILLGSKLIYRKNREYEYATLV